jgi:surfeit locus 1 family protein
VLGTALLIAAVLACIRLGFWQLDRLQQRRLVNARVAERMQAPPLRDRAALTDTATSLYRTAVFTGRYDDARSIVLPGHSLDGAPGVHLLTPLLLAQDDAILVNRGWVPSPDAATIPVDSFPASPTGRELRVGGLLLPLPESAAELEPSGRETGFRRVWYRMDAAALQAQFPYRLLPLQLQLLPAPDAPPWPARLQPPELTGGPHLSYALQWFGFAAIGIVGWLAMLRRSRRPPRARSDEGDIEFAAEAGENA